MKIGAIKNLIRKALNDFYAGRGDGASFEARGLSHRDVINAEWELINEEPELFVDVKRTSYEDGKIWSANMSEAGWRKRKNQ